MKLTFTVEGGASVSVDDATSLAMRARPVETLCGRKVSGRPGDLVDGPFGFGVSGDCVSCARIHNLRHN